MAGRIILDLPNPSLTATGQIDSGSTLTFYENGTTTLQTIYADFLLQTPLANPLGCDSAGRFPIVWAPDGERYSVIWQPTGASQITFDDIGAVASTTASTTGTTYAFATTNALLSAFDVTVALTDGTTIATSGRTAQGDGGGATFYYDSSDTTTVDNGGDIRVDSQNRRFKAVIDCIDPTLFGAKADGSTNDAVAINAALTRAAALELPAKFRGRTYKINATLSVDLSKVLLDGEGATLDFTSLAASPAIAPTTSLGDPNLMVAAHRAHPIRNFTINGPSSTSGFSCFTPIAVTVSSSPWIPGVTYQNVGVHGFAVMHDVVSGDFFLNMTNCSLAGTTSEQAGWVLRSVGNTNSGENMQLPNFILTNAVGFYLETSGNSNMDINANDVSIDGCTYIGTGGTLASPGTSGMSAQMTMDGGHWEAITYTDYAIWCSASFITYGVKQLFKSGELSHVPFKCDASKVSVGIELNDHTFVSDGTTTFPGGHICDGIGLFQMAQKGLGDTFIFSGAISNNRVPNYVFPDSGSLTTNWGSSAQYDNSDMPTGATGSCKLDGTHTSATFATPCSPGQIASAQIQLKITSPGSGDVVALIVNYKDAGDNSLAGTETDTSTASAYTAVQAVNQVVAPPGTVSSHVAVIYVPSAGGATVRFGLPEMQVL